MYKQRASKASFNGPKKQGHFIGSTKRPFPYQKKSTEQELEELQRRREPENILYFQLTKDALVDLAKKAGVINPGRMTKLQLIQAIQTKVTTEDVKTIIEEKKQEAKVLENFAQYNASVAMAGKSVEELKTYYDKLKSEKRNKEFLKYLKLPQGRPSRESYLKVIDKFQNAKLKKLEELRQDYEEEDEKDAELLRKQLQAEEEAKFESEMRNEAKADAFRKERTLRQWNKNAKDERQKWNKLIQEIDDTIGKEEKLEQKEFTEASKLFEKDAAIKTIQSYLTANRGKLTAKREKEAIVLLQKFVNERNRARSLERKIKATKQSKEAEARRIKEAEARLEARRKKEVEARLDRLNEEKDIELAREEDHAKARQEPISRDVPKGVPAISGPKNEREFADMNRLKYLKIIEGLKPEWINAKFTFNPNEPKEIRGKLNLKYKTTSQLQTIADYLSKMSKTNIRRDSKFDIADLGSRRGPQFLQNYQRPEKEKFEPAEPVIEEPQISVSAQDPVTLAEQSKMEEPQAPKNVTPSKTFPTASTATNSIPRRGDPGVLTEPVASTGRALTEPQAPTIPETPEIPATSDTLDGEGRHTRSNLPVGKGIDNHTIDRFLSKFGNEYLGCVACDEIPSKIYPKIRPRSRGFFVMNTDPSYKGGLHWVAIFMDARPHGSNSLEYFDSFADPIPPRLQSDLKGIAERLDAKTYLKLKENKIKFQCESSDNCGHFCMEFICDRMRGKPFPEASRFNDSVRGEDEINRWKTQNGFGFLPSFGTIVSTIAKPISNTIQRVKNVGSTIGNVATSLREKIFFPEKKLPASSQPIYEKYKNYKIMSCRVRREPIMAFVDKFINFISFGKFNEAKKEFGYDKMFHLSLILQLSSGGPTPDTPKLLIEKNERINMTMKWSDTSQVKYFPENSNMGIPGNPTLGQFYEKTLTTIGDHRFFTYNAFDQNCQRFIADLLRSNNALSNDANNFIMQDAQSIVKKMPFYVSKISQFSTDMAGRVKQFFGFGSAEPRFGSLKRKQIRKQRFRNFIQKIKSYN